MSCINPMKLSANAGVVLALWCMITLTAGSIDCTTVSSLTARCMDFVVYGGMAPGLGSPCCSGLVGLYNVAATSVDERRIVCNCLMGLITANNSNASDIARLPGLCGISLGFTIDPNTSCNSIS
ncbi:putative non-specific lipid-transfer protein 14 [Asparagus officinalis]|uniref:putative non-specific lipid-transfer protein 14 n=1 Tax=Asparagus officinalis TaxID=4686 RepID=UPI00098DE8AB|nr:putative non-specific lipid-transfer protein 14 [Asparagus officinalis]